MKLAISNIAWNSADDEMMYGFLRERGVRGLEIAPTRIFPERPYGQLAAGRAWADRLATRWNLSIASMQSIWYGRHENIFGSDDERQALVAYTREAADFAAAIGCGNLVFGCPKHRNRPPGADDGAAHHFFTVIAAIAGERGTVIALEPNPPIYGTNFINDTASAFAFARAIPGLAVNIDMGTIIENGENLQAVADNLDLVNHVHVSEPHLAVIKERALHRELAAILRAGGYGRYISIEMKDTGCIETVKRTVEFVGREYWR